jgi:hypothetical protein
MRIWESLRKFAVIFRLRDNLGVYLGRRLWGLWGYFTKSGLSAACTPPETPKNSKKIGVFHLLTHWTEESPIWWPRIRLPRVPADSSLPEYKEHTLKDVFMDQNVSLVQLFLLEVIKKRGDVEFGYVFGSESFVKFQRWKIKVRSLRRIWTWTISLNSRVE